MARAAMAEVGVEWVFVGAVVVLLGLKVWLARRGHRRTRQPDRRHLEPGGPPREAPDHLPGPGKGSRGG